MTHDQEQAVKVAEAKERKLAAETAALREIQAKNEAENLEVLRKREQARIKEMEARAERERIEKELEARRKAEQERREKEAQVQKKLRQLGICPMRFRWIKQDGGYRCSAGGHSVSDGQLGL